jgi:hypothetical protein
MVDLLWHLGVLMVFFSSGMGAGMAHRWFIGLMEKVASG